MLQAQRLIRLAPWLLTCIAAFGLASCTTKNGTVEGGPEGKPATTLTDAQILEIAVTNDMGEIITSEPAIARATREEVRQFAQDMLNEHMQAANMTRQVAEQQGIGLQANQVSVALDSQARGVAQNLSAVSGEQFDIVYMAAQHTLHQQALNTLDFNLIPAARNPQVRLHLQEKRDLVQKHLNRAREILMTIM